MIAKSILLFAAAGIPASAAISFTGGTHSENFDTLANGANGTDVTWENQTTLAGWSALRTDIGSGTTTTFTTYRINSGSGGYGGSLQSFGSSSTATDRAFGGQNQNSDPQYIHYGLLLTNDTGTAISSFTLNYAGEQWRRIGGYTNDTITFGYQIFDPNTATVPLDGASGWNAVTSLTFDAPVGTGGSSSGVNGNDAGRVLLGDTITGINWQPGEQIWLRWTDNSLSGAIRQYGMAIDDVSFTAVPEPSMLASTSLCLAGLMLRRRRD